MKNILFALKVCWYIIRISPSFRGIGRKALKAVVG